MGEVFWSAPTCRRFSSAATWRSPAHIESNFNVTRRQAAADPKR